MENPNDPEVLAVIPLPTAAEPRRREISMDGIEIAVSMLDGPDLTERKRRELALVRLMVIAIEGILYTDDHYLDVRIETARDLLRELRHCYPELAAEWDEL